MGVILPHDTGGRVGIRKHLPDSSADPRISHITCNGTRPLLSSDTFPQERSTLPARLTAGTWRLGLPDKVFGVIYSAGYASPKGHPPLVGPGAGCRV